MTSPFRLGASPLCDYQWSQVLRPVFLQDVGEYMLMHMITTSILSHITVMVKHFISADDLRINLWNLEISNQSFNIVDVKPTNKEDLTDLRSKRHLAQDHFSLRLSLQFRMLSLQGMTDIY